MVIPSLPPFFLNSEFLGFIIFLSSKIHEFVQGYFIYNFSLLSSVKRKEQKSGFCSRSREFGRIFTRGIFNSFDKVASDLFGESRPFSCCNFGTISNTLVLESSESLSSSIVQLSDFFSIWGKSTYSCLDFSEFDDLISIQIKEIEDEIWCETVVSIVLDNELKCTSSNNFSIFFGGVFFNLIRRSDFLEDGSLELSESDIFIPVDSCEFTVEVLAIFFVFVNGIDNGLVFSLGNNSVSIRIEQLELEFSDSIEQMLLDCFLVIIVCIS